MVKYGAIATVAIWLAVAVVGATTAFCNADIDIVAAVAMCALFATTAIWFFATVSP